MINMHPLHQPNRHKKTGRTRVGCARKYSQKLQSPKRLDAPDQVVDHLELIKRSTSLRYNYYSINHLLSLVRAP